MRHQAIRPVALMLGVMLVGAAPARAATITFEDVVRAAGANAQLRPASEVRLRVAQSGRAAGRQNSSAPHAESSDPQQGGNAVGAQVGAAAGADATLSQSGAQVETVDLGDVTGTVCDCGEIPLAGDIAKAGFPWWLLGGIPLICVSGVCFGDDETPPGEIIPGPTPGPTPTPPTQPIPEPATLLLFGSGLLALGARARRRFGREGCGAQPATAVEEV